MVYLENSLIDFLHRQKTNDLNNHKDVLYLKRIDKLNHYVLHYTKYIGKVMNGIDEGKSLIDTLIVTLSLINNFDVNLKEMENTKSIKFHDKEKDIKQSEKIFKPVDSLHNIKIDEILNIDIDRPKKDGIIINNFLVNENEIKDQVMKKIALCVSHLSSLVEHNFHGESDPLNVNNVDETIFILLGYTIFLLKLNNINIIERLHERMLY